MEFRTWALARAPRALFAALPRAPGAFFAALVLAAATLWPGPVRAQAELQVSIDASPTKVMGLAQLQALPVVEAEVTARNGAVERWRGTPVTEVLKAAGLNLADNLGGGFVSRRVLAARAADGYLAAFGLAEVDPRFGRRVPLVVWQGPDGAPLPPHRGPLMLLAPDDARSSRGVRQLQSLSVTALP